MKHSRMFSDVAKKKAKANGLQAQAIFQSSSTNCVIFDVTCVERAQMFAFENYNSQSGKNLFHLFILKFQCVCSHFAKTSQGILL